MKRRLVLGSLLAVCALGSLGCGYQLQGSTLPSHRGFVPRLAPSRVASKTATETLLAGARDALASEGMLLACLHPGTQECPALVLEILALEEEGAAIRATTTAAGPVPIADAQVLVLRARALVQGDAQAAAYVGPVLEEREVLARTDDARLAETGNEEALRRISRRLGARLVQTLLRQ